MNCTSQVGLRRPNSLKQPREPLGTAGRLHDTHADDDTYKRSCKEARVGEHAK